MRRPLPFMKCIIITKRRLKKWQTTGFGVKPRRKGKDSYSKDFSAQRADSPLFGKTADYKRESLYGSGAEEVVGDSYARLIAPAIEREIRSYLTEKAEDGAIQVFGKNLEQLLMQPPIENRVVLGWDPAFRTGCKLAVVDGTGKVLDTVVIYPTAPQNKVEEAKKIVKRPD